LINASAVESLPLPGHKHIPGKTPAPDHKTLSAIVALTPKDTTSASARDNVGWRYGLRLLNLGYFWEAHEVLECVWKNAQPNSRERHLVQGVIHLANAALKESLRRERAAQRLLELAAACFDRAFQSSDERLMGLQAEELPSSTNPVYPLPPRLIPIF